MARRRGRMNLWISVALVGVAILVVVVLANAGGSGSNAGSSQSARLVRGDSPRLSVAADDEVTFVEFLDLECEACGAAHPAIEELRERYEGMVTFVVRYFPLHRNSMDAARSAEAARAQGKFEAMYDILFERQSEWAERDTSQNEVFASYAREIGLDMEEYQDVVDDPATTERIERDKADGLALGVQGTPTFFVNGERVNASSVADLVERIDAALGA